MMMTRAELKEYMFLSSVKRYEDLFEDSRGFTLKKDGEARGSRIRSLISKGYMEVKEDNNIVVSDAGKQYLIDNNPKNNF